MTQRENWRRFAPLALALAIAAVLKVWLHVAGAAPFNGDEAVVGLMARHINRGEWPAFFYGQAYMGSLDATLVAGAFRLFGEHVSSIRIVQVSLYLLFVITLWLAARRWFHDPRVADIAALVVAIPPIVVTTYTTATLGGYGESLVLGNLILLIGYEVTLGERRESKALWLVLGLVSGLAFWTLGIAGIYILPVALFGLWANRAKLWQGYLLCGLGFFIGSSPWWLYNLNHDWAALAALMGERQGTGGPVDYLIGLLLLGIPAILGLRPPWSAEFVPLPLLLIGLLFYLSAGFYWWRERRTIVAGMAEKAGALLGLFLLVFFLVFVGTPFGVDATGRYLLPLYLPLALGTAAFIAAAWRRQKWLGAALLALVLGLNVVGTWLAAKSPDRITTQFDPITRFDNAHDNALMQFLHEQDETRGYSNYWVTFRLAFLSGEQLIFSAELPYKADLSYTIKDNRYPLYAEIVDASEKTVLITSQHPELDAHIAELLVGLGVTFQEEQIGPYHVFYALSRAVRPEEMGYGEAAP